MRLAPRICGKAYRSPYSPRTVSLWPVRSPLMLDVYTSTWSQKNLGRRGGLGHPNGCPFHALPAGFPKFLPQPMFFESPPRSERCSQKRRFFSRLFGHALSPSSARNRDAGPRPLVRPKELSFTNPDPYRPPEGAEYFLIFRSEKNSPNDPATLPNRLACGSAGIKLVV